MLYRDYVKCRKPYQEDGAIFLMERKHACLFYKPGKGKTYPCIDAIIDINKAKEGKAKVLILSTANAIKNMWESEIAPQKVLPKDTVMLSFNSAIIDTRKDKLLKTKWDIIVVDESHKIKANTSKISRLVFKLSKKTEYVWGLSGTPRGNSDLDIFCQFHNMNIGEWGEISYTRFVENYCDVDIKMFRGNQVRIPIGINRRYIDMWNNHVAKYTQRVEYEEADNMPNLKVNEIKLTYTPTIYYKNAEQGVVILPDYETTLTKLTAIQKLHQAVNGFMYYTDEDDVRKFHRIERNKKLDWLNSNLTKEPTVIVYKFDADYRAIVLELDEMGYTHTTKVQEFKSGKADVLLLECLRGESFNLQMCNRIIFYTMDYSFINYDQMLHRVWRMGQTGNVQIDVLIFDGTIENKIWGTIQNKEKLSDLFMKIKGE